MRKTVHLELKVAINDIDGVLFTDADFDDFEANLLRAAGGFTRRADVELTWHSPNGGIMRDRMRSYALTLPKDVADLKMSLLTVHIRERFRHEAVFIEQIPHSLQSSRRTDLLPERAPFRAPHCRRITRAHVCNGSVFTARPIRTQAASEGR